MENKTFSQLLTEEVSGTGSTPTADTEANPQNPNLFNNVFGEDGAGASYAPPPPVTTNTATGNTVREKPGTFARLTENVRRGLNTQVRNHHFKKAADQQAVLSNYDRGLQEFQSKIAAGELTPEDKFVFGTNLDGQYTSERGKILSGRGYTLEQLQEFRERQNTAYSATLIHLAENYNAAQGLNEHKSEVADKFFGPDSTREDKIDAIKQDGFGLLGDVLAEGSIELGATAAAAIATRGRSLATSSAVQGAIGAKFGFDQEFADSLIRDYGDDIDMSDPDTLRKLFDNKDAIEDARDKALKGGTVAGASAAVGNVLALKGIIPVSKLAGKSNLAGNIAEGSAQAVAQGALGAGTEVGIAAAVDRDVTTAGLIGGAALGVAGGAAETIGGGSRGAEVRALRESNAVEADLKAEFEQLETAEFQGRVREQADEANARVDSERAAEADRVARERLAEADRVARENEDPATRRAREQVENEAANEPTARIHREQVGAERQSIEDEARARIEQERGQFGFEEDPNPRATRETQDIEKYEDLAEQHYPEYLNTMTQRLDDIYGEADAELNRSSVSRDSLTEAEDNLRRALSDETLPDADLEAARIAAVAARKDYDNEIANAGRQVEEADPVATQIEEAARNTPDDDPQLRAHIEKRDGPKSEYDVPESDPRFSAAREVQDEGNLIVRGAARERFNNPEKYGNERQNVRQEEGLRSRGRNESQQGQNSDQGLGQGRTEGRSSNSRLDVEDQHNNGSVQEAERGVQARREGHEPSNVPHATHELLTGGEARPADKYALGGSIAGDLVPVLDAAVGDSTARAAVNTQVDKLIQTGGGKIEAFDTPADLPAGQLRDAVQSLESDGKNRILGLFDNTDGKMKIFKDRVTDPKAVRELTVHEASHAVRNVNQDGNANKELLELFNALGGRKGVLDYAKKNGIDLQHYDDRFASGGATPDQHATLLTDELVAQIHGKESGELKQISRRILSKLENKLKDSLGKDVDLFAKTGGRDKVDAKLMREIAAAERAMRDRKVLGTKYGIVAAGPDFSPANYIPWKDREIMPNVVVKMTDSNLGIKAGEWWTKNIRADGGLGEAGMRAKVAKEGALKDSNIKVHSRMRAWQSELNKLPKGERVEMSKRAKQYLNDKADAGTDIPKPIRNALDDMRKDLDHGSSQVHDRVLNQQLAAKMWQLGRKDPKKYRPKGEDPIETRVKNWVERPELRKDAGDDIDEYFSMIPPQIKKHIDLMETIQKNNGSYLRRSYRAHSDGNYYSRVMDDKVKVEKFSNYLRQLDREGSPEAKKVDRLQERIAKAKSEGKDLTKLNEKLDEARTKLKNRPLLPMDEARGRLDKMLNAAGKHNSSINMVNSGNLMGMNKSAFKAQTLEDLRMREILGEYDDVETAYAQSMNTIDGIVATHEMQVSMMKSLDEMGAISDKATRGDNARDRMTVALMPNDAMSVLNGFHTTPVIESGITYAMDGFQLSSNRIMRNLVKSSAAVNYGKTILSPPTHALNYASNYFIQAANGHTLTKVDGHTRLSDHKFFVDLHKGKPEAVAEYRKLTKLGVVSETVDINELADILGNSKGKLRQSFDKWVEDPEVNSIDDVRQSFADNVLGGVTDSAKLSVQQLAKAKRFTEFLYGAEDDLFKMRAYNAELQTAKKYKNLKGVEAEEYAAQRVREGYLMYSELNRLVKEIKNAPGIGVFVSFPAALIKAAKGQVKLAARDLLDTDLPANVRSRRAIGMVAAYSGPTTIAAASAAAIDMGDEEEQAWRKTLPPWAQHNDILFLGREPNGDPTYIDLSRANPFSYFKIGMAELFKENDETFLGVNTNLYDMAKSFVSPFISTNILTTAMLESGFDINLDKNRRMTNPALSKEAQGIDRLHQFAVNVAPGFATQGLNIFDAAVNDKKWYGSENSLGKAALKLFGINVGRMDRDVSLRFFTSNVKSSLGNAASIVSRVMGDQSNNAVYADVKEALFARRTTEMKSYKDAVEMVDIMRGLKLEDDKIGAVMTASGLSKKVVETLLAGELPQPKVSGNEGKRAYEISLATADSEAEREEIRLERSRRVEMLRRAEKAWLESDEYKDVVQ